MGDQFALMEAVVALAVLLKRFDFRLVPDQDIGMTTGATIHTQNGLFMTVHERRSSKDPASSSNGAARLVDSREAAVTAA